MTKQAATLWGVHLGGTTKYEQTDPSPQPSPLRKGRGRRLRPVVPARCALSRGAHLVTTTTTTGTLRLRGRINGPEKIAHPGMFRPFCRVNAAFLSSATSCSLVVLTRCAPDKVSDKVMKPSAA